MKFKKYNTKDVVPLCYLRELKNNQNDILGKKRQFDNLEELKIPDNWKIQPNDTDAQRKAKKKKVKALKNSFKTQQIEKVTKDKQSKWSSFKDVGTENKKGYFQYRKGNESIFRSPDTIEGKVGVMGSGKGMTNFNPRMKFYLQDNSHLSRLF